MTDNQPNTSLDTNIVDKTYLTLNARGTLIQVPTDVIFKSPVIKTLYQHKKSDEQFYLNFDPKQVHELVDFLSGYKISVNKDCFALMDYCGLEGFEVQNSTPHIIIDADGVEIKVQYKDFINFEAVKKFYATHPLTEPFKIQSDIIQTVNFVKYVTDKKYTITDDFFAVCKEFGYEYKVRQFKMVGLVYSETYFNTLEQIYQFQIDNTPHMIYVKQHQYKTGSRQIGHHTYDSKKNKYTYSHGNKGKRWSDLTEPTYLLKDDVLGPLSNEDLTKLLHETISTQYIHQYIKK
jgi:hypothetical protein